MRTLLLFLLLTAGMRGCVVYEYEHEFWLHVDGSGQVNITARPELWTAFKGVGQPGAPDSVTTEAVRELFEQSGLEVNRVRRVHRRGNDYVFVDVRFDDVNKLSAMPGFRDLRLALTPEGADRLVMKGEWTPPARPPAGTPDDGVMAVRFHMPSKIYGHHNAFEGVQRGNIVGWRQDVKAALGGAKLELGAEMDRRSILWSTVTLFAVAIVIGLSILGLALFWVLKKGKRELEANA